MDETPLIRPTSDNLSVAYDSSPRTIRERLVQNLEGVLTCDPLTFDLLPHPHPPSKGLLKKGSLRQDRKLTLTHSSISGCCRHSFFYSLKENHVWNKSCLIKYYRRRPILQCFCCVYSAWVPYTVLIMLICADLLIQLPEWLSIDRLKHSVMNVCPLPALTLDPFKVIWLHG